MEQNGQRVPNLNALPIIFLRKKLHSISEQTVALVLSYIFCNDLRKECVNNVHGFAPTSPHFTGKSQNSQETFFFGGLPNPRKSGTRQSSSISVTKNVFGKPLQRYKTHPPISPAYEFFHVEWSILKRA
jgi:hypothetical protein